MLPRAFLILLLAALLVQASPSQPATRVFASKYSDPEPYTAYRFDLDGNGMLEIPMPMRTKCIAVDWKSNPQKLYVGLLPVSGFAKIIRCNTDGSEPEDIVIGISGISDIELDLDGRRVYWLQDTYNEDRIYYADMDSLNYHTTVIYHTTVAARELWGLALDVPNQRLWITERGSTAYGSYIRRMTFSGGGLTTILNPVTNPHDIEYCDGKIYWGDNGGLLKADPDGYNIDTILASARINGLAIDGTTKRIYWSDYLGYLVRRVDPNGENMIEFPGTYSVSGLDVDYNPSAADVKSVTEMPLTWQLGQNWPNPFNPVTRINYTVGDYGTMGRGDYGTVGRGDYGNVGLWDGGRSVLVQLIVYDILGREVAVLVNEPQKPGHFEVTFSGQGLASGVYVYRLTAGGFAEARKMVLLR